MSTSTIAPAKELAPGFPLPPGMVGGPEAVAGWSGFIAGAALAVLILLVGSCVRAAEAPELRPYAHLRFGYENAMYNYTRPDAGPVGFESPSQEHAGGGSLGVDIGRHWAPSLPSTMSRPT